MTLPLRRFCSIQASVGHGDPDRPAVDGEADVGGIGVARGDGDERALPDAVLRLAGPAVVGGEVFIHGLLRVRTRAGGGKFSAASHALCSNLGSTLRSQSLRPLKPCLLLLLFCLASLSVAAHSQESKPTSDVLVFANGDQLTGKLERAVAGNIVFKSDMAGELTVPFSNIKELRTGSDSAQFAFLHKGSPITRTPAAEGTVALADGKLSITPVARSQEAIVVAPAEVGFLIDKPTYDRAVAHRTPFLSGWNGAISGGATVVRSTQTGTTATAGITLLRAIPGVPYLPARNRTAVNATESYGKQSTPNIPAAGLVASTVKTNIFHGDAERDEYLSPRLFALVDVSFDHNFSQGLQLQQVYGLGAGWTPLQQANQQLDLKADGHFEKQQFIQQPNTTVTPDVNLFGSTFAENYRRTLPRKVLFTETANFLTGWTDLNAYSTNLTAALAMPVFRRLSVAVSTTDNYLNNPANGFNKNSYQFVTGVTYTLR